MFGLKERMYLEGADRNDMGKFLRSFIPLLWIKKTGKLILRNQESGEEFEGGRYYKVLCSDKMAACIDKQFGFDTVMEKAGEINGEPVDMKVNGP